MSESGDWILLNTPPFVGFPKPVCLDGSEFIVLIADPSSKAINLYKYDVRCNQWSAIKTDIFGSKQLQKSTSLNYKDGTAQIINEAGLFVVDFKKREAFMYKQSNESQMLMVDDELHIIGGFESSKHKIVKCHHQKTKVIHSFNEPRHSLIGHNAIYCSNKKCILLFGADNGSKIYQYNTVLTQWTNIQVYSSPSYLLHLKSAQIVMDKEERFAFILGGIEEDDPLDEMTDNISVYDMENNEFKLSAVKMPSKSWLHAICVNNERYGHLLSFGYCKYTATYVVPYCLMQMIANFMCNEEIHIIYHKKHYKIQIDTILNNLL